MTDARRRRAVARFFERRLLPRTSDARVRAQREAERVSAESYFRACTSAPSKEAFELVLATHAHLERSLAKNWSGTALDRLAAPLVKLALACRDVREKQELSSSVYEMF